jgi:hypothetical protein
VEAFRVICETCRSRLKIRSAEAIGQIHACPKCGSMVHIMPPAGWMEDAAPAAPLVVAAAEPMLSVSSTVSDPPPADFAFEELTSAASDTAPAPVQTQAPLATPTATTGLSPVVWCAIGGAAVLSALGIGYTLWPSKPTQMPQQTAAVADATPEPPQPAKTVEPAADKDPYAVAHAKQATAKPDASKQEEAVQAAVAAATETPDTTPTPPKTATAAAPIPETVNTSPAVAESKQPEQPPRDSNATARPDVATASNPKPGGQVLKFDPLDFDPDHLSLSSGPVKTTTSVPAEPPVNLTTTKPGDTEKAPSPSDLLPPPVTVQAINVQRGPVERLATQPAAADQRLATRIKSLTLSDVTLARFADTLSQLAGTPITLDPIALELNGLSPRTAVSTNAGEATLDKILNEALGPQRMEFVEQEGGLVVALANRDERKAVDFDVKDLVAEGDAAPIAKLIEAFVAPTSWKSAGGKGTIEVEGTTLHIDQSLNVRREALIFCERLRLARHLSLRSKYPAELLWIESPYKQLTTSLSQSTTFTFLPGTRLADVVRHWQDSLGLTVLVDWAALREIDFGPASTLMCSANDRPWTESLDGILHPLDLGWWAVDARTIQITSLDALEQIKRVEFYAVPKQLSEENPSAAAVIGSVQKQISDALAKSGKSTEARIEFDAPSGRLIVRAGAAVHRVLSGQLVESAQPLAKRD